jgi:uncharacterized protein with PIN domain
MILDSSAVVAIFFKEPQYEILCVGEDFPQTDIPLA